MKLIKKSQVYNNVNNEFGMGEQIQKVLMNGNAQFIIDLSRELKISYSVPSLAMHISNIFFYKKCYVNYDRFVILAGAYLLAEKLKDVDSRLKHLSNAFYNIISRLNRSIEPFNETKMQLIKDQICIAQTEILRTLEYQSDYILPHQYVKKYCEMLIQDKEHRQKVFFTTRVLILDSYRTPVCLCHTPLTIFVACFLIACRYDSASCYSANIIRNAFTETPTEEQMYLKMLEIIGENEKLELKAQQVRDCLITLNQLIYLFGLHHNMQQEL